MLTQSGAPGRVTGWTNFSHQHSVHGLHRKVLDFTGFAYYLFARFGGC